MYEILICQPTAKYMHRLSSAMRRHQPKIISLITDNFMQTWRYICDFNKINVGEGNAYVCTETTLATTLVMLYNP